MMPRRYDPRLFVCGTESVGTNGGHQESYLCPGLADVGSAEVRVFRVQDVGAVAQRTQPHALRNRKGRGASASRDDTLIWSAVSE
jgi:hypothetical protein